MSVSVSPWASPPLPVPVRRSHRHFHRRSDANRTRCRNRRRHRALSATGAAAEHVVAVPALQRCWRRHCRSGCRCPALPDDILDPDQDVALGVAAAADAGGRGLTVIPAAAGRSSWRCRCRRRRRARSAPAPPRSTSSPFQPCSDIGGSIAGEPVAALAAGDILDRDEGVALGVAAVAGAGGQIHGDPDAAGRSS